MKLVRSLQTLSLALCFVALAGCQSHQKSCGKDGASSCNMKRNGHDSHHGGHHGEGQPMPSMHGAGELHAKGFEVWANSANLTADEKSKLAVIHNNTGRDAMRIKTEIGKAKMELFGELAKAKYDKKKVDSLKRAIVKLDSERLDKMFSSLEEVEKVLGKDQKARDYYKFLETLEKGQF